MIFRKILFAMILATLIFILPAALKRLTHSFHLARLAIDLPHSHFDSMPDESISRILSQDFDYLGRGSQAFVFASRDGGYVLKLLIFDSMDTLLHRVFQSQCNDITNNRALKTLEAFDLARRFFAFETGVVYMHLEPSTGVLPAIRLHGPAWHRMTINLDRYRFVLQQRALPLDKVLLEAYRNNDHAYFKRLVDSLDQVITRRLSLGIDNTDPTLFANFGVISNRAVEIDFGNFVLSNSCAPIKKMRYFRQLFVWAECNCPKWKGDIALLLPEAR